MRVRFPRLPDHERAWALVERELRITDGIWGAIAAGVVFDSMQHVSGRRPPHAAGRSAQLKRSFQSQGLRAEVLADLVSSAAALGTLTQDKIRRLADDKLSVLPESHVDPVVIAAAARALQVEAARWARLRVGEELCYEWPGR